MTIGDELCSNNCFRPDPELISIKPFRYKSHSTLFLTTRVILQSWHCIKKLLQHSPPPNCHRTKTNRSTARVHHSRNSGVHTIRTLINQPTCHIGRALSLLQLGLLFLALPVRKPEAGQAREEAADFVARRFVLPVRILHFHCRDRRLLTAPVVVWRLRAPLHVSAARRLVVGWGIVLAEVQVGVLVLDAVAVDVGLHQGTVLILLHQLATCNNRRRT